VTRPVKRPKPKRERDTRPADYWMKEWLRMKREEPKRFERMTKGKKGLLSAISYYERTVEK